MSILHYLKLQPVDPQTDGTVSSLDDYDQDETIDLTQDEDGEALLQEWVQIENDLRQTNNGSIDE
ncbi:MAG: hypothetical protein WAR37_04980 [Candidatus Microsaccharimonas sp.]